MFTDVRVLQILTATQSAIVEFGFVPTSFKVESLPAGFCDNGTATFTVRSKDGGPIADVKVAWSSDVSLTWLIACSVAQGTAGGGSPAGLLEETTRRVVLQAFKKAQKIDDQAKSPT